LGVRSRGRRGPGGKDENPRDFVRGYLQKEKTPGGDLTIFRSGVASGGISKPGGEGIDGGITGGNQIFIVRNAGQKALGGKKRKGRGGKKSKVLGEFPRSVWVAYLAKAWRPTGLEIGGDRGPTFSKRNDYGETE